MDSPDVTWTQTIPNWIMAIAASYGVIEIVRGQINLKKQQKENDKSITHLNAQVDEMRRQTNQFEYQTGLMNESNKILERGIDNLTKILGKGQEVEEERMELERQRRIIEIRPYFNLRRTSSNPNGFTLRLVNQGGTATDFRIIDLSTDTIEVSPIKKERIIDKGQELEISGRSKDSATNFNSNIVTGQILLGYTDTDGNKYQQNIIKNYSGYQVGLPMKIEQ